MNAAENIVRLLARELRAPGLLFKPNTSWYVQDPTVRCAEVHTTTLRNPVIAGGPRLGPGEHKSTALLTTPDVLGNMG